MSALSENHYGPSGGPGPTLARNLHGVRVLQLPRFRRGNRFQQAIVPPLISQVMCWHPRLRGLRRTSDGRQIRHQLVDETCPIGLGKLCNILSIASKLHNFSNLLKLVRARTFKNILSLVTYFVTYFSIII